MHSRFTEYERWQTESHFLFLCDSDVKANRLNCYGAGKHYNICRSFIGTNKGVMLCSHSPHARQLQDNMPNKTLIRFSPPQQRRHGLRCHFWHEHIISFVILLFSFQCCCVPPIRLSEVEINFSASLWKMAQFLTCSLRTEVGEAHWRSGEWGRTFVWVDVVWFFWFFDKVIKYRQHVYIIIRVINNGLFSSYTRILIWQIYKKNKSSCFHTSYDSDPMMSPDLRPNSWEWRQLQNQ